MRAGRQPSFEVAPLGYEATRETERADASHSHAADRPPTSEEKRVAKRALDSFGDDREEVAEHYAEHYKEMTDVGVHVKGEGSLE